MPIAEAEVKTETPTPSTSDVATAAHESATKNQRPSTKPAAQPTNRGQEKLLELLHASVQGLPQPVIVADDSERIVEINSAACAVFDLEHEEIVGQKLSDMQLPGAVRGAWLAFLISCERTAVRKIASESGVELLLHFQRARPVGGAASGSTMMIQQPMHRGEDRGRDLLSEAQRIGTAIRNPLDNIETALQVLSRSLPHATNPTESQERSKRLVGLVRDEAARIYRLLDRAERTDD